MSNVLFAVLKDKKNSQCDKELRLKQLGLNYVNNQKKQNKKEHLRLVISSIMVGVVDENRW